MQHDFLKIIYAIDWQTISGNTGCVWAEVLYHGVLCSGLLVCASRRAPRQDASRCQWCPCQGCSWASIGCQGAENCEHHIGWSHESLCCESARRFEVSSELVRLSQVLAPKTAWKSLPRQPSLASIATWVQSVCQTARVLCRNHDPKFRGKKRKLWFSMTFQMPPISFHRFHSKAILQTLAESPGGSMQALTAGAPPGGDAGDISWPCGWHPHNVLIWYWYVLALRNHWVGKQLFLTCVKFWASNWRVKPGYWTLQFPTCPDSYRCSANCAASRSSSSGARDGADTQL